jgi:hypothetical protein
MRVKGLRYCTNPNTPFSSVLHNANVVDTVLYPPEELADGAGNCSDLTVLYDSLLESVSAHTASSRPPATSTLPCSSMCPRTRLVASSPGPRI